MRRYLLVAGAVVVGAVALVYIVANVQMAALEDEVSQNFKPAPVQFDWSCAGLREAAVEATQAVWLCTAALRDKDRNLQRTLCRSMDADTKAADELIVTDLDASPDLKRLDQCANRDHDYEALAFAFQWRRTHLAQGENSAPPPEYPPSRLVRETADPQPGMTASAKVD